MHILAAIDLSETTETVLRAAMDLARHTQAQLTLLHVAAPEPDFVGYEAGPDGIRETVAHELRAEHRHLEQLRVVAEASGIGARVLMVQGATAEKLLSHSERLGIDYLVVGSKRQSLLGELVVGSVARDVLRGSRVPVLVVPLAS
jgi:nucleotide-binding universal stress UspA family protein